MSGKPPFKALETCYGIWPGGRMVAMDSLLEDGLGNRGRFMWTRCQETGETREWWVYQFGMLGRR